MDKRRKTMIRTRKLWTINGLVKYYPNFMLLLYRVEIQFRKTERERKIVQDTVNSCCKRRTYRFVQIFSFLATQF